MATEPPPHRPTTPTRVRYVVLVLLALAPLCAYLTRGLSAFNTTIAAEFDISNRAMGDVIAGFALGYFFFQVPGGMLASAFGVRTVLPAVGIAWSLCAVWGSLARSPEQLQLSRVALGFAQAGLVPCCAQVVADWFPLARRGLVSSVLTGSMQLGGILATGLSAALLEAAGWRLLLQAYAAAGIAWAVVFFVLFRNRPASHPGVNAAEAGLIAGGRAPAPPTGEPGASSAYPAEDGKGGPRAVLAVCLRASLWAYFVQQFFRAYGYDFFLSWCPAYLEKTHGVPKAEAGQLAAWPIVAFGTGSILGGFVVDAVLVRTGSRRASRCGSAIVGLCASAGCFALATRLGDPRLVVGVLSVGCLFAALGGPATWAAGMDVGGRCTPVVFGVMNMAGNIGAYFSPKHVGGLFDHVEGSGAGWDVVLWLLVGIHLAAAAAWLFVDPGRPVSPPEATRRPTAPPARP